MRVLLIGATENEKIPQALRHDHILFDHIPLPGTEPLLCPEGLYDVAVLLTDSVGKAAAQQLTALLPSLREDGMSVPLLIVAAHLSARDRILVLDGGRVSALGAHRELIDRPGIYRDIYDIQMRSDDRALVEEGGNA